MTAESMLWLAEAKICSAKLVESSITGGVPPTLRDVPDTPLELAVASSRHIAGIIQYLFGEKFRKTGGESHNIQGLHN